MTVFLGHPLLAQRRSGSFRHPLLPPLPVNSTGLGQNNRKECQVHVLDRPIIHFHTLSHTHNGGEGEGTPLPGPGPLLPGPGKIFLAKLAKKSVIFGQIVECYGLNNYILKQSTTTYETFHMFDAFYVSVITLSTVGYGSIYI